MDVDLQQPWNAAEPAHAPELGEGIYTFPQATQILSRRTRPLSTRQVRYWMTTGLVPPSYEVDGQTLLSFHDLISLEVVARFLDAGWSVQGVRKIEEELRAEFRHLPRPFAYRVFYTDEGRSLWGAHHEGDEVLTELIGKRSSRRHKPLAWSDAIQAFAEEIRFDGPNEGASAWDLSPWIEINPQIQFGAPVVRGTRVPIATVAANLEAGTPRDVAEWYDLSVDEVLGVRDYVAVN